ncbi:MULTISPECIES: protease SohB [Pasteurellaceae]|uniref:Protease SohB n=1 Tax=Pasteurella atlantica TaxID=2827233 RepID=A0AAW8CH36_9PAST|nr:protease SohB [Pasteurella atlantica]MBR0574312.1 protease SohB [Pasteurella atlantica]MDP8040216.1 protease SohB [Pasteurella atlantica]MDP8042345.1 protease SohB [Pasteurella atlantica]MDP8044538.1 protease SohB [Pasteurella atlantica]MDP8046550.1 protease SohB [Pasteurella atlantica]
MWKEVLLNYGIFLLELLTVFGVVIAIVMMVLESKKQGQQGEISVKNLTEKYKESKTALGNFFLSEAEQKAKEKAEKKEQKAKAKAEKKRLKLAKKSKNPEVENEQKEEVRSRLFVLNFNGDIMASGVDCLRKEIDAVVALARPEYDEVLLKLESPGGVVHGYGLAASQLARLKERHIPLTITVDKVAASGGYMMACVADKIISAPFAVIGSIGVVAQVPNIHRLLKKHDVDVDVMTAGEYKRTVTLMGENSKAGKKKFQQELEETHKLFKQFVTQHRPQLNIEKVATGEHWFGQQALDLKLVDEISTSDDAILNVIEEKDVIEVKFTQKKNVLKRFGIELEQSAERLIAKLLNKSHSSMS